MIPLAFLKANWLPLGLATIIVGLLVTLQITDAQRDSARAQRDLAEQRLETLGERLEDQNDAVSALEAAAVQNREAYLAGIAAANKRAVRLEIKAEDILNLPQPEPERVCEATEDLLRKGLTE
jgi:hypothetical protein